MRTAAITIMLTMAATGCGQNMEETAQQVRRRIDAITAALADAHGQYESGLREVEQALEKATNCPEGPTPDQVREAETMLSETLGEDADQLLSLLTEMKDITRRCRSEFERAEGIRDQFEAALIASSNEEAVEGRRQWEIIHHALAAGTDRSSIQEATPQLRSLNEKETDRALWLELTNQEGSPLFSVNAEEATANSVSAVAQAMTAVASVKEDRAALRAADETGEAVLQEVQLRRFLQGLERD